MTVRPWHVVVGWGIANLGLAGALFAFPEGIFAEVLYLVASVPLGIFALAVWYSDHISHSGVRDLGGSAFAALPFAFGCFLTGIGAIYDAWITVVGVIILLASGFRMVRAAPARLHATPEELAGLPMRTLTSPPTFSTEAIEEAQERAEAARRAKEAEQVEPDEKAKADGRRAFPTVAIAAAAGVWLREIIKARRRDDEQ